MKINHLAFWGYTQADTKKEKRDTRADTKNFCIHIFFPSIRPVTRVTLEKEYFFLFSLHSVTLHPKKWPNQIFPMVTFVFFPHDGHSGLGGGGSSCSCQPVCLSVCAPVWPCAPICLRAVTGSRAGDLLLEVQKVPVCGAVGGINDVLTQRQPLRRTICADRRVAEKPLGSDLKRSLRRCPHAPSCTP